MEGAPNPGGFQSSEAQGDYLETRISEPVCVGVKKGRFGQSVEQLEG